MVLRARRLVARRAIDWPLSDQGILGLEGERAGAADGRQRDEFIYEPGWNESERLLAWRTAISEVEKLPALICVAVAWDQWLRNRSSAVAGGPASWPRSFCVQREDEASSGGGRFRRTIRKTPPNRDKPSLRCRSLEGSAGRIRYT